MNTPKGEINDKIIELVNDEAILAKMSEAKSPEECYDIVKDRVGVSFEEFKASMEIAMNFVNESQSGLLSDEDLEQVAGGKSSGDVVNSVFGGIGAIAGAASAIVAACVA